MKTLQFSRGTPVMIDETLSGPAAGRIGWITGNVRKGHYEVTDRHPAQSNAQTIGWFEPEQLVPLPRR